MFIDSHCHLNFPELKAQLPQLLDAMAQARVSQAVCISTMVEEFPQVKALADAHPQLFATVGVHPDTEEMQEPTLEGLVAEAHHPKVVAIGETGLDYYRLNGRSIADMEWQRERFRIHIRAARQTGKPLVIHTRSSAEDTLRLMREEGASEPGGVLHCFTETMDVAKAALDLDFHISFSGIVTFKNAADLREVAKVVPLDRILIETDSPYLAPVPYRGKTNQPAYVPYVAALIAELRGMPVEAFAEHCTANTRRLFRLPAAA
ncbi:TatD DNase family protein [Roseateles sp. YR242]|uniref:TatD family hydrolase n=1 Tax=Roseateles sp. YR242 TaxID=1855305 RepID=UPI0008B9C7D0|nr:TatD family hydrolase [Roseateles sp. YR242]SEK26226.1 TatD DNase family protein [Roseateles sp. YR242]